MHVTPGSITVLIALVALTAACGVLATATIGLWWAVKQVQPIGQMRSKVSELSAMVDNLEAQVINLRTRKAAKASPRTKPASETPDLAELDTEEQALFREAGFLS